MYLSNLTLAEILLEGPILPLTRPPVVLEHPHIVAPPMPDASLVQAVSYTHPDSERLQLIHKTIKLLEQTCVSCWARGVMPQYDHQLGDCPDGLGTMEDKVWTTWRKDLRFTPGKACFGCGVPYNVSGEQSQIEASQRMTVTACRLCTLMKRIGIHK